VSEMFIMTDRQCSGGARLRTKPAGDSR